MASIKDEIKRRLTEFKTKRDFDGVTMVLLCFPSEAKREIKEGLIKPHSIETPRVLNWYNLTPKGVEYFKNN